ncbi:MAG: NADH:flavin oxidoreductase/NADH oxidase [Leucobacter sp.]
MAKLPSQLFQPIRLRSLEVKHRLWVAPMCQYQAVEGVPQPWHRAHLGALAIGNPGLIIAEATGVRPDGRITDRCTGIWNDEQEEQWRQIVAFADSLNVPMALQIAHAGRKGSTRSPHHGDGPLPEDEGAWQTVAPSAIAYADFPTPHPLTVQEIAELVQDFAAAARRAVRAGFAAIEIHAAHGYLIHEFLSPLSNERTDDYGGSLENRARFLLEIVDAVRGAIPEGMPLFVRLSASDWTPEGWDVDELVQLAVRLEAHGVDLLDISSAGLHPDQQLRVGPGYQLRFAREVRRHVGIPVAAVGLIETAREAESAIIDDAADVVLMGRQFLRVPTLPLHFAAELGGHLEWPEAYGFVKLPGNIP